MKKYLREVKQFPRTSRTQSVEEMLQDAAPDLAGCHRALLVSVDADGSVSYHAVGMTDEQKVGFIEITKQLIIKDSYDL